MKPTKFDDFIKSNTQDELPVPTELSWENMNFTLPPAKRKRRILPFLFFLTGAVGMGSALWYVYQHDNNLSQSLSKSGPIGIQNQNSKIILKKEDASLDKANPQDAGENSVTSHNVTNQETFKTELTVRAEMAQPQDAIESATTGKNAKNQENFKTELTVRAELAQSQDAGENAITAKNQQSFKTERPARAEMAQPLDAVENTITGNAAKNQEPFKTERLATIEREEGKPLSLSQAAKSNDNESATTDTLKLTEFSPFASTEKTSQISSESLAPCILLNALPIKPIRYTSSENHITLTLSANNDSKTKQLTKIKALLVHIGANRAQMNYNSAGMNSTETPAWGNSYQILFEQELKDNWLISLGLGYQQLHTTFYYEKDLGTYVDFSRLQVIRQTRRVCHNNYFDFVSLNLGGGKQFKISPRWQAQLLLYLSPSHLLSYTGKSIDDAEAIITFDPNTVSQNKWLLNADAALRFSYNLNNTDLIFGVNLSQALTKSDVVSGSTNTITVQPRVFGLNLGIKRFLGMQNK